MLFPKTRKEKQRECQKVYRWKEDKLSKKKEYKATQYGAWDEGYQGELI